jgi:hypothetical protein
MTRSHRHGELGQDWAFARFLGIERKRARVGAALLASRHRKFCVLARIFAAHLCAALATILGAA